MRNKTLTLTLILTVVVIIGIASFLFFNHSSNLKFTVDETCELDIDPYLDSREGILKQTWIDEDTLKVEAYVSTYCEGGKITGDYIIDENDIVLKYDVKKIIGVSKCDCPHKVIYEISGLEKEDYSISIISHASGEIKDSEDIPLPENVITEEECLKLGGEIFNTLGESGYSGKLIGKIEGLNCPCVCRVDNSSKSI